MAPHPSTLAWKIPWTEEPDGLQSMGLLRVGHDWATSLSLFIFMHWRRNGNPLQCSCLENPRDGGAWWAAVYGVAQSRTRLKRFSSSILFLSKYVPFHTVHGILKARILKFAIPISSGPRSVRTLHHDLSILGGPTWHGSLFHWVRQGCDPCDQFGWFSVIVIFTLMDKDKSLMEASWWERLTVGETGSCSDGRSHAQ